MPLESFNVTPPPTGQTVGTIACSGIKFNFLLVTKMVINPLCWVSQFPDYHNGLLTVHLEAVDITEGEEHAHGEEKVHLPHVDCVHWPLVN